MFASAKTHDKSCLHKKFYLFIYVSIFSKLLDSKSDYKNKEVNYSRY